MAKRKTETAANQTRKAPRQNRSRATVDAILQATQDCLVKFGAEGLTTTRVAERAGCSVGTLYQYFPSREALIAALIQTFGDKETALVERVVAESPTLEAAVASIIRAYFAAVAQNHKLFLPLTEALYTICRREDVHRLELAGVKRFKQILRRAGYTARDLDRTAFISSYTYIGLLRFCTLVQPRYLKDQGVIDGVVEMVTGYLKSEPKSETFSA
jgi:AcrR family transcriptional regulator